MAQKIRVFLCKPGLDGHDRGVLIVGQALRDAGMEVIYSGLKQTSENLVEAAIQEDVDVLGLSMLSGAHMALIPRITQLLADEGATDIMILAGGLYPPRMPRSWCATTGSRASSAPGPTRGTSSRSSRSEREAVDGPRRRTI
jgi:methylmalonyl-CoA mutase C-terminal domain/subunit